MNKANGYFTVRLKVSQQLKDFVIERGVWASSDLAAVARVVHDMRDTWVYETQFDEVTVQTREESA